MARVISHYTAAAGGSSAMYYYALADDTSKAVRIDTGTAIKLPEDYILRSQNSMLPTIEPGGWMFWYYVQNIQPVYQIVADPCTVPDEVVLDVEAKTLSIVGGTGGDLNEWSGFAVSYRQRQISSTEWSDWSQEEITALRTVAVSADSGMVRQYRVRTMGSAGSDYYSPYVVCQTLLIGNTPAGTPVVLLPLAEHETFSNAVSVKINCPPEPDGDGMMLQKSLNGGFWMDVAAVPGTGGVVYDSIPVSDGAYHVRYRLMDANGKTGEEDNVVFTRVTHIWKREITSGAIIANREISFVSDIAEMLECLNRLRAFYGLGDAVLPGEMGRLADWQSQLNAMQEALDECRIAAGWGSYGFAQASAWPDAQQINHLRMAMEIT